MNLMKLKSEVFEFSPIAFTPFKLPNSTGREFHKFLNAKKARRWLGSKRAFKNCILLYVLKKIYIDQ